MSERLELVRDFTELRDGMTVVVKQCASCGRDHRGILLPGNDLETLTNEGTYRGPNFAFVPPPPEMVLFGKGQAVITPELVAMRSVFRVVYEEPAAVSHRRELERTR